MCTVAPGGEHWDGFIRYLYGHDHPVYYLQLQGFTVATAQNARAKGHARFYMKRARSQENLFCRRNMPTSRNLSLHLSVVLSACRVTRSPGSISWDPRHPYNQFRIRFMLTNVIHVVWRIVFQASSELSRTLPVRQSTVVSRSSNRSVNAWLGHAASSKTQRPISGSLRAPCGGFFKQFLL